MATFPQPHKLGANFTRWALSELLAFEAARDGKEPPATAAADERYLNVKQVAARYQAGTTTIWRWADEARKVAA